MKFTNFGKKLLAFVAVAVLGLILVSCGGGNKEKEQHQANVNAVLDSIFFDETLLSEVKGKMTLVQSNGKYPDVKIEWNSSELDLIAVDGSVNRPGLDDSRVVDGKVEVTLTVTASQGEAKGTKEFKAYVVAEKKVAVSTIKDIKNSFYTLMKEGEYKVGTSTTTKEIMISAEITGNVLLLKGTDGFFFTDGTDLLYVYKANSGVKVGDTVHVTGNVYSYYGAVQFGDSVVVEVVESQTIATPSFAESTIDAYTAELNTAKDATSDLILDVNTMLKYNGYGYNLYAKVGKGGAELEVTGDTYHLEDPYTGQKVALYYYSTKDYEAQFDALVGKYVNIKVFTYDCYSKNHCYRVLYSGQEITEAEAPSDLTDANKVEIILAGLSLDAKVTSDVTLPVVEGVVWSLKEASSAAVIENGVLKVTRPENGQGNATVVVVATATVGTATDSKEISVEVVEKEDSGIKEVNQFEAEKAYKLGLFQGNLSKQLWLTGEISGRYASTTENPAEAADVKVVEVEGGYQLVVAGKYLEFANNADGKISVVLLDAPTAAWTYDAQHNTFLFAYGEKTYFLGTYNDFNTLSASEIKYIDSGNFISHLYEVEVEGELPPVIEGDVVITAQKLFAGISGKGYADHNGDHVVDGITYTTSQVMVAQGSSAQGVEGYLQCQASKGQIANKNAYEKAIKTITFTFWNTYETPNLPTIKAGATADSLTEVKANLSAGVKTGVKNSSGYEYYEYTITYTLPEGCYFWAYSDSTKGAKYFSQIVLSF